MSGTLFTEPGRFPRGEAPQENFAFYDSPYAKLTRGVDRDLSLGPLGATYEPIFSLQGDSLGTYTQGVNGGAVFDLVQAYCWPIDKYPALRMSTGDFLASPYPVNIATEGSQFWKGCIKSLKIGKSCINILNAGGVVGVNTSELVLDNNDLSFNYLVTSQAYLNQRIDIYGVRLYRPAMWTNIQSVKVFTGVITGISKAGRTIVLTLGDATHFGDTRQLVPENLKFDGATNNGGESLKDQPLPCCIGDVSNISPVYLGQVDLGAGTLPTFQVHFSAINDVTTVRVRGAAMAKVTSGTPTVGQYRPFNALGKFQTGSTPSGAITCDVQGATGGTYGYSAAIPNVIRKMIVDVSGAVTSAFTPDITFANLLSIVLDGGFYWGPQKSTLIQALNTICGGSLATVHGMRDGRIGAFYLDLLTPPVFDISDNDCLDATELPLPADYLPRPDEIEMGYEFNFTKLTDISELVTGDLRTWLGQENKKYTATTNLKGVLAKPRKLELKSLLKDISSATKRVDLLRTFFEREPRVVQVITPYYMGQVELGMTATVTLTQLGIQGRDMVVAEFQEDYVAGRLQLTFIG